ncbi:glycosyl hydrolase [Streptomyces acidicola]|uniref:glycosyl hydrolase n=1 Tax=Streptomyces acidicola TaxID=2596892 RepID=UPI00379E8974
MAAAATGALPLLPLPAAAAPRLSSTAFGWPAKSASPKIRWWMPMADTDPAELVREVDAIADAGIGGVELIAMATPGVDTAAYGWGSPAWEDRVTTVLRAARARDVAVDLTIGSQWPAATPAIDADSPGASQELVYGHTQVAAGATFNGPVPAPGTFDLIDFFGHGRTPGSPTLVALTAARLLKPGATAKPVLLDPDSVVDLTSRVRDGAVTWTAPGQGQWLLFSFWQRGTGQTVTGAQSTSYVVDHYAAAGSDAVSSYWDSNQLTPAIRRLIHETGGDLFEDSLELQFVLPWTNGLSKEFRNRRGYALTKYLPVLFIESLHKFNSGSGTPESPADYDFPGDTGYRIRNDFYQVLTELYETHHLDRIRSWANSLGLRYRSQVSYGSTLEMASAATHVDVPETEQFYFRDSVDSYRAMAGGVHLGGKQVYSVEAAPVLTTAVQDAYGSTWQRMLEVINLAYAGGVNQAVFHGFAHATAPGAAWPGWSPFAPLGTRPGFAEAWGPRQPSWRHMPDINGYLARQQHVLRAGSPRVDLAVYRQGYWDKGAEQLFSSSAVARAGFSYEAVSPTLLALGIPAKSGLLAPEGPAYQALVIPAGSRIDVPAAKAVLKLAQHDVPVVIVGSLPERTPFFEGRSSNDAQLQRLVSSLRAQPRVRQVAEEADITAALSSLHVSPRLRPSEPTDLWSVMRQDRRATYFWLYNPGTSRISTEVSLTGQGTPYLLDAWTGETSPLPKYRTDRGRITLGIDLAPSATMLLALAEPGVLGAAPAGAPIIGSTADVAWSDSDRGATLRATRPGTYSATYANGKSRSVRIADVPAAIALTDWHLSVEDWQPGADATRTKIVKHELDLTELLPWPQIPALKDVSGIGRYTTSFTLPKAWTGGHGAHLDLGKIFDTVRVTVNGDLLPPVDLHNPVIDLKGHLRTGKNVIEVEVSTTLRNRLRTLVTAQAGTARQDYGLLGPVTVEPYGEVLL